VQAQILELLDALCRDFGLALVLVTHDLPSSRSSATAAP
jgi:ABC-type dipeptide/oligopeptide/nickel transport system, ATPase component